MSPGHPARHGTNGQDGPAGAGPSAGAGVGSFVHELRRGDSGTLLRVSAIAAIGGLLFGYDTGVISGALLYIKDDLHAGTGAQQWIVSSLLVGAILGAVAAGYLADRVSRKYTKVVSGTIYVVGALGCAFAVNVPMLIGFRFVLGLSVGTASFVAPLYISEVAPPRVRGGSSPSTSSRSPRASWCPTW